MLGFVLLFPVSYKSIGEFLFTLGYQSTNSEVARGGKFIKGASIAIEVNRDTQICLNF